MNTKDPNYVPAWKELVKQVKEAGSRGERYTLAQWGQKLRPNSLPGTWSSHANSWFTLARARGIDLCRDTQTKTLYVDEVPPNGRYIELHERPDGERNRGKKEPSIKPQSAAQDSILDERINAFRNALAYRVKADPKRMAETIATIDKLIINVLQ